MNYLIGGLCILILLQPIDVMIKEKQINTNVRNQRGVDSMEFKTEEEKNDTVSDQELTEL